MNERSTNKLYLVVDMPNVRDPDDLRRTAAMLLRDAAERIEQGQEFGGFAKADAYSYDGAYLLGDFRWEQVGMRRPEPHEMDARIRGIVEEFIQPERQDEAFKHLRPNGIRVEGE